MKQFTRFSVAVGAAGLAVVVLGLAGCGGKSETGSASGGQPGSSSGTTGAQQSERNAADVSFVSHLILHYQQSQQLSDMAGYQASNRSVRRHGSVLGAAKAAEVKQLATWLVSWGEPVPSPSHGEHGGDEVPGTFSEDELSELGNTADAGFDQAWLRAVIKHHQGAVAMAKIELADGRNPKALALAKKIQQERTQQIAGLRRLMR